MHRSLPTRVFMLLVVLSAIAACAPIAPIPTRVPDATATLLPTSTPTRAPDAIAPFRPAWTPLPTLPPLPTKTPAPTPVAVYPPLAALARGQVKLDGSTSTQPLRALIACQAIGATCYWDSHSYSEERPMRVPTRYSDFVRTAIGDSGTHGSYVTLMEGKTDVILVARGPSDAEVKAAKELGVTFDARRVALDALVFLVNVQNPLNSLRQQDARSIYAGRTTDWRDVGGTHGQINAYQRDDQSGSQELLKALVMKDLAPMDVPQMVLTTMGGPIDVTQEDPQGIGYSVYYYATTIYPYGQIKLLSIDGIPPTSATIASRAYPLIAEVYVVVRADLPKDSPTLRIRDWLLSEAGQTVVKASGYVSVPPVAPTPLASSSRVRWAYSVLPSVRSSEGDLVLEDQLDTQGKDGWEYVDDLLQTKGGLIALFKRPSSGADRWRYSYVRSEEVPAFNLVGKDGWEAVSGLVGLGGHLFKRSESSSAQWEYQRSERWGSSMSLVESALERAGVEGWELYFCTDGNLSFKRRLGHPVEWRYEAVSLNMGMLDAWNSAIFAEEGLAGWEYVPLYGRLDVEEAAEGEHYLFKRPSTNATPWEYKGIAVGGLLSGPPGTLERFLNEQGQEGWELVDMTRFELLFRRHP
jgi:phosphate transport system substrate-binding protein